VPPGFIAVSVYVVFTVGDTVTDVRPTRPIPLSSEVELALLTFHESVALWPAVMVVGVAVKELMIGAASGCATVAEHVLVATDDEASVACMFIEKVPGVFDVV